MEEPDDNGNPGRRALRLLALPLVLIATATLAFFIARHYGVSPAEISGWIREISDRWWAPAAFVALYAIATTFFFPATALVIASGAVWGWFLGGVWALVAGVLASSITYFAGRMEAGDFASILKDRATRLHGVLEREGFLALLVLRVVPAAPFAVVNYAAGIAGIGIRDFFVATTLGMLPGSFILSYFASAISAGLMSPGAAAGKIALAGALLVCFTIGARVLARKFRMRQGS